MNIIICVPFVFTGNWFVQYWILWLQSLHTFQICTLVLAFPMILNHADRPLLIVTMSIYHLTSWINREILLSAVHHFNNSHSDPGLCLSTTRQDWTLMSSIHYVVCWMPVDWWLFHCQLTSVRQQDTSAHKTTIEQFDHSATLTWDKCADARSWCIGWWWWRGRWIRTRPIDRSVTTGRGGRAGENASSRGSRTCSLPVVSWSNRTINPITINWW